VLAARDVEVLGLRGTCHTSEQGVGECAGLQEDAANLSIGCVVGGSPRDKADTTLIERCENIRSLLLGCNQPLRRYGGVF
jgi:hypothetical protein